MSLGMCAQWSLILSKLDTMRSISKNGQRRALRKTLAKRGQKEGKKWEKSGRKIKLKTTGNEVDEWDARWSRASNFLFVTRVDNLFFVTAVDNLFVTFVSDCHWGDGLRPWLTCLSRPLADRQTTILVIVLPSFCNLNIFYLFFLQFKHFYSFLQFKH